MLIHVCNTLDFTRCCCFCGLPSSQTNVFIHKKKLHFIVILIAGFFCSLLWNGNRVALQLDLVALANKKKLFAVFIKNYVFPSHTQGALAALFF